MLDKEREVKAKIDRALEGLPPKSQDRVVRRMLKKTQAELADLQSSREDIERQANSLEAIADWLDEIDGSVVLEPCKTSKLHKLSEASMAGRIYGDKGQVVPSYQFGCHTFLVNHQWLKVIGPAMNSDDEWRLPYDICCFEFTLSGRHFISFFAEDDQKSSHSTVMEGIDCWLDLQSAPEAFDDLDEFIYDNVKAIAIALDAEVAESEVVRAPHKLNKKREKGGKPPIKDYHVIDLARRHRCGARDTGGDGPKKRLHFRRGHWRHYDGFKTWVKWCLVGDPDLGFVDKDYSA